MRGKGTYSSVNNQAEVSGWIRLLKLARGKAARYQERALEVVPCSLVLRLCTDGLQQGRRGEAVTAVIDAFAEAVRAQHTFAVGRNWGKPISR